MGFYGVLGRLSKALKWGLPCLGFVMVTSTTNAQTSYVFPIDLEGELAAWNENLLALHEGDSICIGSECFTLGKHLGSGRTAQIWSLADDPNLALRIPKGHLPGVDLPLRKQIEMIQSYVDGIRALEEDGVRVPHLQSRLSPYAVLIERRTSLFTLRDFLNPSFELEQDEFTKALEALEDFVRSVAGYAKLGDFHPGQLHFTSEHEWVLFDVDGKPKAFVPGEKAHAISLSDTRNLGEASVLDGLDFRFSNGKILYEEPAVWLSIRERLYGALKEKRKALGLILTQSHSGCLEVFRFFGRLIGRLNTGR